MKRSRTAYALKQLVQAGVRVFFYLEDRERTLDSPTDKVMLSLTAFADELEREKARQRTFHAMRRKAEAGHVTGGRVFGYDNVRTDAGSVTPVINETEAETVRGIYTLYAAGHGLRAIAHQLNEKAAPCPRSQQGRPKGWAPSSIREVLHWPLYRGEIVWNKDAEAKRMGAGAATGSATGRVDEASVNSEVRSPQITEVRCPLFTACRVLSSKRVARGNVGRSRSERSKGRRPGISTAPPACSSC